MISFHFHLYIQPCIHFQYYTSLSLPNTFRCLGVFWTINLTWLKINLRCLGSCFERRLCSSWVLQLLGWQTPLKCWERYFFHLTTRFLRHRRQNNNIWEACLLPQFLFRVILDSHFNQCNHLAVFRFIFHLCLTFQPPFISSWQNTDCATSFSACASLSLGRVRAAAAG